MEATSPREGHDVVAELAGARRRAHLQALCHRDDGPRQSAIDGTFGAGTFAGGWGN
jgi:hypothetical protein